MRVVSIVTVLLSAAAASISAMTPPPRRSAHPDLIHAYSPPSSAIHRKDNVQPTMDDDMITIITAEKETFKIPRHIAELSRTMNEFLVEEPDTEFIPLPNVDAKTLAVIMEWSRLFHEAQERNEVPETMERPLRGYLNDEEETFFKEMDQKTLFDVTLAANYLNMEWLLEHACLTIASMIRGKKPEEIREMFNIVNDFTPEEEAEIVRENQWAFE